MDAIYLLIGIGFFVFACVLVEHGFRVSKP